MKNFNLAVLKWLKQAKPGAKKLKLKNPGSMMVSLLTYSSNKDHIKRWFAWGGAHSTMDSVLASHPAARVRFSAPLSEDLLSTA